MKKISTTLFCTLLLLIATLSAAFAQDTLHFEHFNLPADTFLNNAGEAEGFSSGDLFLPNHYNPTYDSWSGWAISSMRDTLTPGFLNQYSAIPGAGAGGSSTYAVSFVFGSSVMHVNGGQITGMYVTNSTYAYLSMRDGDGFAKKFGGETGEDPDFFLLTVKKYLNGTLSTDSVDFYLADYRFEDPGKDYLVKNWSWLDLSALGEADSLVFLLSSSDVGQYGMNTPAYFCVDNVVMTPTTGLHTAATSPLQVYPNPAREAVYVEWPQKKAGELGMFDLQGRMLRTYSLLPGSNRIALPPLPAGMYLLRMLNDSAWGPVRLMKW